MFLISKNASRVDKTTIGLIFGIDEDTGRLSNSHQHSTLTLHCYLHSHDEVGNCVTACASRPIMLRIASAPRKYRSVAEAAVPARGSGSAAPTLLAACLDCCFA
jgi:hypothetical protein